MPDGKRGTSITLLDTEGIRVTFSTTDDLLVVEDAIDPSFDRDAVRRLRDFLDAWLGRSAPIAGSETPIPMIDGTIVYGGMIVCECGASQKVEASTQDEMTRLAEEFNSRHRHDSKP
jgi:hypothetical protein